MIKKIIKKDLTKAVKEKNPIIRDTLRMLLAFIFSKEKEKRYRLKKEKPAIKETELAEISVLTDDEIIGVIASEVKKRKEAILEYEKGKREDLVQREKAELEVLQRYLPKQLSEQEIKKLISEKIEKVKAKSIKDIGVLMAELIPEIKGKADTKEVSEIVKKILSSEDK